MTEHPYDHQAAHIVVGVDGSPAGIEALRFALGEGVRRGRDVVVVTAWEVNGPYDTSSAADDRHLVREHARQVQTAALEQCGLGAKRLPEVRRRLVEGHAATALIDASAHADLLVVGNGHKGALRRALVGSVSRHCLQHATCPVTMVPETANAGVGVAPLASASARP